MTPSYNRESVFRNGLIPSAQSPWGYSDDTWTEEENRPHPEGVYFYDNIAAAKRYAYYLADNWVEPDYVMRFKDDPPLEPVYDIWSVPFVTVANSLNMDPEYVNMGGKSLTYEQAMENPGHDMDGHRYYSDKPVDPRLIRLVLEDYAPYEEGPAVDQTDCVPSKLQYVPDLMEVPEVAYPSDVQQNLSPEIDIRTADFDRTLWEKPERQPYDQHDLAWCPNCNEADQRMVVNGALGVTACLSCNTATVDGFTMPLDEGEQRRWREFIDTDKFRESKTSNSIQDSGLRLWELRVPYVVSRQNPLAYTVGHPGDVHYDLLYNMAEDGTVEIRNEDWAQGEVMFTPEGDHKLHEPMYLNQPLPPEARAGIEAEAVESFQDFLAARRTSAFDPSLWEGGPTNDIGQTSLLPCPNCGSTTGFSFMPGRYGGQVWYCPDCKTWSKNSLDGIETHPYPELTHEDCERFRKNIDEAYNNHVVTSSQKEAMPLTPDDPGLPTMYFHVSPSKNHESIMSHGLDPSKIEERVWETENQEIDMPHGIYLWDNFNNAYAYAHVLANRQHGLRQDPMAYYDRNPEWLWHDDPDYLEELKQEEPESFPEDFEPQAPPAYNIYSVPPEAITDIKMDPENTQLVKNNPLYQGMQPEYTYEEAMNYWAGPEDYENSDDMAEGHRYYTDSPIPPQSISLIQSIPLTKMDDRQYDNAFNEVQLVPEPLTKVPNLMESPLADPNWTWEQRQGAMTNKKLNEMAANLQPDQGGFGHAQNVMDILNKKSDFDPDLWTNYDIRSEDQMELGDMGDDLDLLMGNDHVIHECPDCGGAAVGLAPTEYAPSTTIWCEDCHGLFTNPSPGGAYTREKTLDQETAKQYGWVAAMEEAKNNLWENIWTDRISAASSIGVIEADFPLANPHTGLDYGQRRPFLYSPKQSTILLAPMGAVHAQLAGWLETPDAMMVTNGVSFWPYRAGEIHTYADWDQMNAESPVDLGPKPAPEILYNDKDAEAVKQALAPYIQIDRQASLGLSI